MYIIIEVVDNYECYPEPTSVDLEYSWYIFDTEDTSVEYRIA